MKALDVVIADTNFRLQVVERDGMIWIPIKPICEAIGVVSYRQTLKIQRDERCSCNQLVGTGTDGKQYQMIFIPQYQLEGFLFTINARASMKPHVRERLLAFQKGLTLLIHNAFNNTVVENEMNQALIEIINDLREELKDLRQQVTTLQQERDNDRSTQASFGGTMMARKRWNTRTPKAVS